MKYEIPYEELAIIGLSKEMVDSLPDKVKDNLVNGELTPVINYKRDINGTSLEMPMKLRMEKQPDGTNNLMIYPMNREMHNSMNLSEDSYKLLLAGGVVFANNRYLQRETETNCIIEKTPQQLELDKKIQELEKVKDIELGMEQKKQIKEGKPVELNVGGESVTVGLDLREKEGFTTLKGDMENWKRQKEIAYDIAHPEFVGIVQTDENRWEYQKFVEKEDFIKDMDKKSQRVSESQSQKTGLRL